VSNLDVGHATLRTVTATDRRRSGSAGAIRTVAVVTLGAVVVLLLRDAVHFIASGVGAVRYPFELDYGEGPVLNQIVQLAAGHSIYRPLRPDAYAFGNYPPVFYALVATIDLLVGNPLAMGRALSVAAALLTAVVIGLLVWRAAPSEVGPVPRALSAAVGGLAFLRISYVATWAPLLRVDMVACLLAFAGVWAFTRAAVRGASLGWYTVPFLLAFFTKQSAVAAAAACLVVGLVRAPRRTLRFAAPLAAMGIATFATLVAVTHGEFYFHVVTVNHNLYSWTQTAAFLRDALVRYPIELAIALVFAISLLADTRRHRGTTDGAWERPVLGVYLLTSVLVSLTVGKLGADVNYLIELMAVVCAAVGVAIADGFAPSPQASRLGTSASAIVLPALLLWQVTGLAHRPAIEWVEIPDANERQETSQLLEMLRHTPGPVLSEDMTLLVLAGKPVEFQPFDMTQLAYMGLWDQRDFVQRIANDEFSLIILRFDVAAPSLLASTRFSSQMLAAIRAHYESVGMRAGYFVYGPLASGRGA
jgi:hypothetical protein